MENEELQTIFNEDSIEELMGEDTVVENVEITEEVTDNGNENE